VNTILVSNWIKVYPNPFKEKFTVLVKAKNTGTTTFKLFDNKGNLFFTKQVSTIQGQAQIITFDNLQPLAKGVYNLYYSNALETGSIRVVAQ
jgi:hypothetical protein